MSVRYSHTGASIDALLTVALGGSTADLTINCSALTGWPTGASSRPFFVVVDQGNANEEKILCSARTGNVLTVFNNGLINGRAADGTAISAHDINAPIQHVFTALEADEANAHINASTGIHGVAGSLASTAALAAATVILEADIATKPTVYTGTSTPTADASGALWMDGNFSPPRQRYWNGTSWAFSGAAAPTVNEGASSGATFTTLTNPDGDGKNYRLGRWTSAGLLVVTAAGAVRAVVVAAGSTWPAAVAPGNGGMVFDGFITVPVGSLAVAVGAIGTTGGSSSLSTLVGMPGGTPGDSSGFNAQGAGRGLPSAASGDGYSSNITGSAVAYGAYSGPPGVYGNAHNGDLSANPGVVYVRWEIP